MPDAYPGKGGEMTPLPGLCVPELGPVSHVSREGSFNDQVEIDRTVHDQKVQVTYKQVVSQRFFLNLWFKGQNTFFQRDSVSMQFRTNEFIMQLKSYMCNESISAALL